MDILEAPSLGPPPGDGPKPGRPAMGAAQRALSDDRYVQMTEMMEALPPSAREFRFHVFEGNPRTGIKDGFMPLRKILFSKYKELGLVEEGTLAAYLDQELGSGFYIVEAYDNHGARLEKLPPIPVKAGDEDDMDDEYEDDERSPRRRRRSRGGWRQRDDWDDGEDDRETRVNTADMMSTIGRQQSAQVAQVSKSSTDMVSMMLMTQQSNAEARQAEERRRDEQRSEERKIEEKRAEDRRSEQERDRRERDEREERRREEVRLEQNRMEDRRREETRLAIESSNKRMEVILGGITAALPLLSKLFEPKEDKTLPLLVASMSKPPDPMLGTLLQSILAKANDPSAANLMMQQMMEFSKVSSQMTAEQMKGVMSMSSEMNTVMMKKAMEMMLSSPQGQTPEGKSMIEQVMGALGSAAEIVKTFLPPAAAQPAVQPQQQRARNIQHTPVQPAVIAPATGVVVHPNATPGAVPVTPTGVAIQLNRPDGTPKTQAEILWETLTPEQQAAQAQDAPRGIPAVLGCLKAINTVQYTTQAEYQQLIGYMVTEMPLDLRVAVLDGNEMGVAGIVMPVAKTDPETWAWLTAGAVAATATEEEKPSTLDWIRTFVKLLPPSIEGVHGPADTQRALLASGAVLEVDQKTVPVVAETPTVEPTPDTAPAVTGEAAPIIPGPGSIPAEPTSGGLVSPLAAAAVASIDPDEP